MTSALFTWFGASTRHIAKYAFFHRNLGAREVVTIRTRFPPQVASHLGWQSFEKEGVSRAHELKDVDVAHVMSGGMFKYVCFRNAVPEFRPRAVICDSGPYLVNAEHIDKFLIQQGIPFRLAPAIELMWDLDGLRDRQHAILDYLRDTPLLILNSEEDSIVPRDAVSAVVELQGEYTKEKLWKTGKHVQLLRTHPKEYEDTVRKFLNKSMENKYKKGE